MVFEFFRTGDVRRLKGGDIFEVMGEPDSKWLEERTRAGYNGTSAPGLLVYFKCKVEYWQWCLVIFEARTEIMFLLGCNGVSVLFYKADD